MKSEKIEIENKTQVWFGLQHIEDSWVLEILVEATTLLHHLGKIKLGSFSLQITIPALFIKLLPNNTSLKIL